MDMLFGKVVSKRADINAAMEAALDQGNARPAAQQVQPGKVDYEAVRRKSTVLPVKQWLYSCNALSSRGQQLKTSSTLSMRTNRFGSRYHPSAQLEQALQVLATTILYIYIYMICHRCSERH